VHNIPKVNFVIGLKLLKKLPLIIFILMLAWLQYRLWWGEGSFSENRILDAEIVELKQQLNLKLSANRALRKDIENLKNSTEVLEEIARERLGLIKPNEHFFRVIPDPKSKKTVND
jgi:cell division protein FtsB